MENFQQEGEGTRRGLTLAERINELERQTLLNKRVEITKETKKEFKFPFKWRSKFKKTKRKVNNEKVLVIFLNKKNEIEVPKFMPIFDGNMVIYKDKPYEFDPRAIWTIKGIKGNPKVYLIKEIDRRPIINRKGKIIYGNAAVSNMDIDEIRARGDSTESDAFLIKAALKAQTFKQKRNLNIAAMVIIGIIVVGGLLWFLLG